MKVYEAIDWKFPGSLYIIRGDKIETWLGPGPQPSEEDIKQIINEYEKDKVNIDIIKENKNFCYNSNIVSLMGWMLYIKDPESWTRLTKDEKLKLISKEQNNLLSIRKEIGGDIKL